jgi:hypothetical protein
MFFTGKRRLRHNGGEVTGDMFVVRLECLKWQFTESADDREGRGLKVRGNNSKVRLAVTMFGCIADMIRSNFTGGKNGIANRALVTHNSMANN